MKIVISHDYMRIVIPYFNPKLLKQDEAVNYVNCGVTINICSLKEYVYINDLRILIPLYNGTFFDKYKIYHTSVNATKTQIERLIPSHVKYLRNIDNLWAQAFLSTYGKSIVECYMEYKFGKNWRGCIARSIDLYGKPDSYCIDYMLKTWIFEKELNKQCHN